MLRVAFVFVCLMLCVQSQDGDGDGDGDGDSTGLGAELNSFFYVDAPVDYAPYPSLQAVPIQAVLTPQPGIFTCRTILAGTTVASVSSRPGFHSGVDMTTQITLIDSATSYEQTYNDPNGYNCATAWNMLFGGVRCGFLNPDTSDSDRFVWRRHIGCVNSSSVPLLNNNASTPANTSDASSGSSSYSSIPAAGAKYVQYISPCIYSGQAQLAAYAYDNGVAPVNGSAQLVVFDTVLNPDAIYTLHLRFDEQSTTYDLLGGDGVSLLETHTITHTYCDDYAFGANLDLRLGSTSAGSCPAPTDMQICYSAEAATWGTELWRRTHVV